MKHKILFICHGNICRSPMAEFVMKHLVKISGREHEFEIASAAVSTEEIDNDIYPPAKRKLQEKGIPFTHHAARQITPIDYKYYDYIICMDHSNLRRLNYIIGSDNMHKVSLLMQWTAVNYIPRSEVTDPKKHINNVPRSEVTDPWYTRDFETTYQDVMAGCTAMLQKLS